MRPNFVGVHSQFLEPKFGGTLAEGGCNLPASDGARSSGGGGEVCAAGCVGSGIVLAEMEESVAGSNHWVAEGKVRALHGGGFSLDTFFWVSRKSVTEGVARIQEARVLYGMGPRVSQNLRSHSWSACVNQFLCIHTSGFRRKG